MGRKILLFYRHFPVAMGRYIHWALEELGHDVFSCGPYSGSKIPWGPQFDYPEYMFPPDLELPDANLPVGEAIRQTEQKGFYPDVIIQAADTIYLEGKAPMKNIVIGTDPHVIDYHQAIKNADVYVSMQKYYLKDYPSGSLWMPYGFDPNIHKYLPNERFQYHVVFCGLQYPQRKEALRRIAEAGWKVYSGLGHIYEEYTKLYNSGMIAFNWSSKQDLPARFWEGLGMRRCVLTNRVPDLHDIPLEEGVDYIAFSDMDEAVEKASYYLKRPEALFQIANNGYKKSREFTWKNRVERMLKECQI